MSKSISSRRVFWVNDRSLHGNYAWISFELINLTSKAGSQPLGVMIQGVYDSAEWLWDKHLAANIPILHNPQIGRKRVDEVAIVYNCQNGALELG